MELKNMGFFKWLGLLFIGLRLMGHIDWSWWLVLMPIVLPAVLRFLLDVAYETTAKLSEKIINEEE